jgi:hypothetical protein
MPGKGRRWRSSEAESLFYADTPIRQELDAIAAILPHLGRVVILVDDVRCFDPSLPEFSDYPSRDWLVEWAGRLNLRCHIEHDIFIVSKD